MHVKRGVEERETSLALPRPGAGLKQDFEVLVKRLLPWNKDSHFVYHSVAALIGLFAVSTVSQKAASQSHAGDLAQVASHLEVGIPI